VQAVSGNGAIEKTQPEQLSIVMQSLLYWEQEKQKALQLDEIKRKHIRCKPDFGFSGYLPRWEKRLRRRLGQVQIVVEDLPQASPEEQ
jgi:hypothetical protein